MSARSTASGDTASGDTASWDTASGVASRAGASRAGASRAGASRAGANPGEISGKEATGSSAAAGRWVLGLTATASFMVALDALVVTTALGTIRLSLHASLAQLEWTVNAYTLTFAAALMTAAALGDRFGRRRVFVAGIGLFTAASAACALAPGAGWLIAARTVQGVGAAMVMPLAMALLTGAFPPRRRGWALGIFGGVTGLAVGAGPVVGGAIAQGLAWQWIFWLNVPIGLAAIPLVLRRIGESRGAAAAVDLGGIALVTGAGFALVWGLVRADAAGWGSPEVVGAFTLAVVLAAGLVGWESRVAEPMLPMRLFRSRAFAASSAVSFLLQASLTGAVFFMAQFQQDVLGQGPLGAGLRLLPWTATLFLVAPQAGRLADRFGERPLVASGLFLQAAGLAWIAAIAGPGMSYPAMIAPMILAGAGVSMAMPAAQKSVMSSVAPAEIGKASGTFQTARQLGSAVGVAILVAVFAAAGGYGSPQVFSSGFRPALGVAAGLSLAGSLAGLALPSRRWVSATSRRGPATPRPRSVTPGRGPATLRWVSATPAQAAPVPVGEAVQPTAPVSVGEVAGRPRPAPVGEAGRPPLPTRPVGSAPAR